VQNFIDIFFQNEIKMIGEVLPDNSRFVTAAITLERVPSTAPPLRELLSGKKLVQIDRVDRSRLTTEEKKLISIYRESPDV
jgi:hypothetical protein